MSSLHLSLLIWQEFVPPNQGFTIPIFEVSTLLCSFKMDVPHLFCFFFCYLYQKTKICWAIWHNHCKERALDCKRHFHASLHKSFLYLVLCFFWACLLLLFSKQRGSFCGTCWFKFPFFFLLSQKKHFAMIVTVFFSQGFFPAQLV